MKGCIIAVVEIRVVNISQLNTLNDFLGQVGISIPTCLEKLRIYEAEMQATRRIQYLLAEDPHVQARKRDLKH